RCAAEASSPEFRRSLRGGRGATFPTAAFDERRQRFMHDRIQGGWLEGRKGLAPPGVRALGRGLGAIVVPGTEVPPVRNQRSVEGVAVALHGVGCREEMAAGAHLRDRLDAELLGR